MDTGEYKVSTRAVMNWDHPHFEQPQWLWLALLGPVPLVLLQRYASVARRRQLARIASPHFVEQLTQSHSPARRTLKNSMLVLAMACVGIALARPQWGEIESRGESLGEDVVFALDCSQSMMASDVAPSRLMRSKLAILDFVRRQAKGRVGLVAFAGSAFLQCPLTFDYDAFADALEAIDLRTIPVTGTDIGRALTEAHLAMERGSRRKTVVLVTDGEDLEERGLSTAQSLATNGVVVFCVGVGTSAGGEVRVLNAAGQLEPLRNERGEVVRSRLDEKGLQAIAEATGGSYHPLGRLGEGLMRVSLSLKNLDAGRVRENVRTWGVERFHIPIAVMLCLLVFEPLLGTRRRMHNVRQTKISMAPVAVLGIMLLAPVVRAAAEDASTNATGTNSLSTTNAFAIPQPLPQTAHGLYNVGTQLLDAGKLDDAERLFVKTLQKQDELTQPAALYNLGHVRFRQGELELKKDPGGRPGSGVARNRALSASANQAILEAEAALASDDVHRMVQAYLAGRGVRRELRAAVEAFNEAMKIYAATLLKWDRALGDFRSASELNPTDQNAVTNATIVEQHIARLIDRIRQMQQSMMPMVGSCPRLNECMKKLKGRIPKEMMPPGAVGGEEEEEELVLEMLRGFREGPAKSGKELEAKLSPEEAGKLLEGMRIGDGKRLPMGFSDETSNQEGQPSDRKRQPW